MPVIIDIMHIIPTITTETRYQIYLGSFCSFTFKTSIIHIVISIKAKVNITLLEFGSKNTLDWNISNGISEIIPKNTREKRYFFLFPVLKNPSTRKKAKSGNAILPKISNASLIYCNIPHLEEDISVLYSHDP